MSLQIRYSFNLLIEVSVRDHDVVQFCDIVKLQIPLHQSRLIKPGVMQNCEAVAF